MRKIFIIGIGVGNQNSFLSHVSMCQIYGVCTLLSAIFPRDFTLNLFIAMRSLDDAQAIGHEQ